MLLVIDNYDSFTWNLVQGFAVLGADPVVRRNDEVSVAEALALGPDRIVISPGPAAPGQAGISVELIRQVDGTIPVLGVCLGHQAIAVAHGGRVRRAAKPMHGKISAVEHSGDALFEGVASPFRVTRYHSLVVDPDALPDALVAIAWTAGATEIQGLRRPDRPVWGVQFHPESITSESGMTILHNFLEQS